LFRNRKKRALNILILGKKKKRRKISRGSLKIRRKETKRKRLGRKEEKNEANSLALIS
jgi:hypothetical protein